MSSEYRYYGGEQPNVQIFKASESHATYHIDRDKIGYPRPRDYDAVSTAMVKLALTSCELEGELEEKAMEALEATKDLMAAMTDARIDDKESHDWYDLYMWNPAILPEVSREPPTEL